MNKIFKNILMWGFMALFPFHLLCLESREDIWFRWALSCLNENGDFQVMQPDTEHTIEGDYKIKAFIQPVEPAYIYLYHYNSRRELSILFPGNFDSPEKNFRPLTKIYIPAQKGKWLESSGGEETYLLIASRLPLKRLEALTHDYLKTPADDTYKMVQKILAEIKGIQSRINPFTLEVKGSYNFIGNLRGDEEKIAYFASEIKGTGLYACTVKFTTSP